MPRLDELRLLELLLVLVLPELDELPLLGRLTLPELLPVPLLFGRLVLPLFGRFTLLDLLPELGRLELDELPLLGRLTLPELLLELGRLILDELPLPGRVVTLFWLLLVPLLFGRIVAPFPFRLLVGFGRTVAPLFEPLLTFAPPLPSSRELRLPGVLPGLCGRTVACELPLIGAYPSP